MQNSHKPSVQIPSGKHFKIGIVQARFNTQITNAMLQATCDELARLDVLPENIITVQVAGALEIPLALQVLAEQMEFNALIALGCIIRGETYHFELVSNESTAGITRVGLDYNIPIANAVLTTENEAQAQERIQEKSKDAAQVAIEMAHLIQKYPSKAFDND